MDFLDFLRAVLALAVTLGLIGLAAWVARKYAPDLLARLQARKPGERRLKTIETLVLDPTKRLVLVQVDGEERLILLGEGRELNAPLPGRAR
ncbi:MAG TPA: flagellar biosynthetic protein FliO [Caulobacteraceae bacterium]|nr:flagellar biosynthetic protein FliO [Caulobacteraceae bacterium]